MAASPNSLSLLKLIISCVAFCILAEHVAGTGKHVRYLNKVIKAAKKLPEQEAIMAAFVDRLWYNLGIVPTGASCPALKLTKPSARLKRAPQLAIPNVVGITRRSLKVKFGVSTSDGSTSDGEDEDEDVDDMDVDDADVPSTSKGKKRASKEKGLELHHPPPSPSLPPYDTDPTIDKEVKNKAGRRPLFPLGVGGQPQARTPCCREYDSGLIQVVACIIRSWTL